MRKLLVLLFLCYNLSATGTIYYIATTGNNTNNGSSAAPWKTLAYACSKAIVAGDIIHVRPGTFTESSQSFLLPGVSIEGEGTSSVIYSTFKDGNLIELTSSVNSGVNGNQSVSNLLIEGGTSVSSLIGYSAIKVIARSNVEIHHCTFQNFSVMGVIFWGGSDMPTLYPVGCRFHDNIMTNCSRMLPGKGDTGEGSLCIGGQQAMLVYNNTIICNLRPTGNNGYCIKYYGLDGINKGLKIYNNTLTADVTPSGGFNFAIEMWANAGGFEIYNNIIHGCVDIVNCEKDLTWYGVKYPEGLYSFGTKIYNNTIGWDSQMGIANGDGEFGIRVEMNADYLYIYNNHFKNLCNNICLNTSESEVQHQNFINIYYNIFENVGSSSTTNSKGWGIRAESAENNSSNFDTWNIWNNVISAKTSGGGTTVWGIVIPWGTSVKNLSIRNNIISNFKSAAVMGYYDSAPVVNFSLENNIYYNNTNDFYNSGGTAKWTNFINQNNLKVNPLFVSATDFHLQAGSPAIGKGLAIPGITTDCAGCAVKNPPCIGALEYGTVVPTGIPVFQSAAIENATPALLEITYDLSLLATSVPASSSFKVMVNGIARTINSVKISGTKLQLTLASPVVNGDVITVSYTRPSVNPVQTASGGLAISYSSQNVTNKVLALTLAYVSSSIENATPAVLGITYNLTLANVIPSVSSFGVKVNSLARSVNSLVISGTQVRLTLSGPIVYGDIVTVSYTKPSTNPIQSTTGAQAASLASQTVTNNVLAVSLDYVSASIENAAPSLLIVKFNLTLANVVPSALSFVVKVNSRTRTVSSVIISGKNVQLTLSRRVYAGYVVTVSYTKPAVNPLQTVSGVTAASFTNKPVVNNCTSTLTYGLNSNTPLATIKTVNINDTTATIPVEFVSGPESDRRLIIDAINLYPNPNNGHFSVGFMKPFQNEKNELVITDLAGKMVYSQPVSKEEILKRIDLSEIHSGMYIMIIRDNKTVIRKNFIKIN